MAGKSNIARGLLFGAEFFSELNKELRKSGFSEEKIIEIVGREFKTGSDLTKEVAKFIVVKIRSTQNNEFLKLISVNTSLVLGPADGSETLADAKDFWYIDPDFKNWGTDEKGSATKEASVGVYEMTKDATFAQMFTFDSLKNLCLTHAQIIGFIRKHRDWLRADGYATFFPFVSKGQFFVAGVFVSSVGRLGVNVDRFEALSVWGAGYRHRVVLLQLT